MKRCVEMRRRYVGYTLTLFEVRNGAGRGGGEYSGGGAEKGVAQGGSLREISWDVG